MERAMLIAVLALTAIHCYGAVQVQMPETAELQVEDNDLQIQIKELQRNVSDIWTYIYELRSAVSQHLTHLRQHQVEIETSVHKMEHLHEDSHAHDSSHGGSHAHDSSHGDSHAHDSSHGDSHVHSGDDHHSHSGEQHSHGDDHGSDHHHSHSGEQHSHDNEHHSHSGEHHSHSGEHGHHSHSYSHSHAHGEHGHSKEDSSHSHSHDESDHHHHDHDHKDSHETEDLTQTTQQVQQVAPAVAEPVVVPTNRHEHYHHNHESRSGIGNGMNLMGEHSFHSHHHHGHHSHNSTTTTTTSSRNRTVQLPKYSEYDMYDFASCNVQSNKAIPEELQQNVEGQVILWQKKSGGPLNFHVRLQGFKIGDHHGHHGAHQAIQQEDENETPQEAGHRHGFHIHSSGDLSNGCQSTGPHYNPKSANHGAPNALVRHVGDLGNIECDNNGITNILFSDDLASLRGQYSVVGKAIVIHSDVDDLGQGGDEESLRTGNAGTRIACCVIQKINKLPIRNYRAMKNAIQYQNR